MLNVLRPLLLLAALAAVAPAPAEAQRAPRVPREDAGAQVRQVERDGGRVLQAQPMQRGGQEVYRYKVLTPEGRVRVLQGAPSQRPAATDDGRPRLREPRPIGGADLIRERQERARERQAAREAAAAAGGDPPRRE